MALLAEALALALGVRGGASILAALHAPHHGARRSAGGRALAGVAANAPCHGAHGGPPGRTAGALSRRASRRRRGRCARLLGGPRLALRLVLLLLLWALAPCRIHGLRDGVT